MNFHAAREKIKEAAARFAAHTPPARGATAAAPECAKQPCLLWLYRKAAQIQAS